MDLFLSSHGAHLLWEHQLREKAAAKGPPSMSEQWFLIAQQSKINFYQNSWRHLFPQTPAKFKLPSPIAVAFVLFINSLMQFL